MSNINIIKLNQVKQLTTLSSATIYRLIAKGEFPKQIKISERSSGWIEHEVTGYIDECISNRSEVC